ncbi:hypothetical protein ACJ41O_012801 [Fusarium nematophilum]
MLSPAKLLVAAMAFATIGVAAPAQNAEGTNLEVRACTGGYSDYNDCLRRRRASCTGIGLAYQACFNAAGTWCASNC